MKEKIEIISDGNKILGTGGGILNLINSSGEKVEDTIPEDQSLFFDTEDGIVLISGCGHAGIVNTLEHVKKNSN